MRYSVWGFRIRFEGNKDWEWAAPSLLMDATGMCTNQRIVEIQCPFNGITYSPASFIKAWG
jgi:3'-phosphoadenosine 5'-phosphosulfate (PAPS) 3'-phosphatase